MKELIELEKLEIKILEFLKNKRLLNPLIFVGGTMLRLCHELPRYSTDLDFWFAKNVEYEQYFTEFKNLISRDYQITDSENKTSTLLFEIKNPLVKRKLKIEMRKFEKRHSSEKKIAFSPHSNQQVLLNGLNLDESLKSKIEAALSRKEIRDFFDIEFLLRKGISLPFERDKLDELMKICSELNEIDFKVKLGSIIDGELRAYYIQNRFKFLEEKIRGFLYK